MQFQSFRLWLGEQRAWLLRAALLTLMLPWAQSPPPLVVLGPAQTVQTRHPIVCTHTRLTDEVEPWKILRTLEMARQMGAPTITEYFPWAYYESHRGRYDFAHADQRIDFARNQGLTVIARLGGMVPEWARRSADNTPTVSTYLPPDHYGDFASFVHAFVQHFQGRIQHIIIWNEPNVTAEWGFRPVDPEGYTALLKLAYQSAKQANPDIVVLGGALAPTLEPEGSELAMNDLVYLELMYAAGAADYFDALSAHVYGLRFPPAEPPAPDVLSFRRIELLREIMLKHGDADTPVYITESGWNDSPRWVHAVKPGLRIDYTLAAYAWAEEHWPYVRAVCTWAFRYPVPQYAYGDYFTLVSIDFTPKLIYEAIREWATQ